MTNPIPPKRNLKETPTFFSPDSSKNNIFYLPPLDLSNSRYNKDLDISKNIINVFMDNLLDKELLTYDLDYITNKVFKFKFEDPSNKPRMLVANSIRGKGIPMIEDNPKYWFGDFQEDQLNEFNKILDSQKRIDEGK